MHAGELAQLAGLAAYHGPALLRATPALSSAHLQGYWSASRCRHERWSRAFRRLADHAAFQSEQALWPEARGVLEEVLLGEVLVRVWGAVVTAIDRRHGQHDAGPVARSVFLGHQEARRTTLAMMLHGPAVPAEQAVVLNRLRRKAERWTDMLLGYLLLCEGEVDEELAFEPARARDFAADMHDDRLAARQGQAWPLLFSSLQASFQQKLAAKSPNGDLNEQIAASVLSCFPPSLFDGVGLVQSLWMVRISAIATDTQHLLTDLLATEAPVAPTRGTAQPLPPTQRPPKRF